MAIMQSSLRDDTNVGFYLGLLHAGLLDWASASETYSKREFTRDWREISNRAHREGIGFLTKTLPRFAKAIDIALATGSVLNIAGFKFSRDTKLPKFFGTLLGQIFDDSGRERSDASPVALLYLRQLLYLYYKLELPPNENDNNKVLQSFVETDAKIGSYEAAHSGNLGSTILGIARTLVRRVLGAVDPLGKGFEPRHGPGSVSTGEKGAGKTIFKRYYERLARVFDYDKWFYYNPTHLCDDLVLFNGLETLDAGTAKVVLVPKDSRGPRLISCEPLEYQWIQQGLLSVLVGTIEKHPFTQGRVNFLNQEVNRSLALAGSTDPDSWVTLDMKDASDRVSLALVRDLFPEPWYAALYAARSSATELPCGRIVHLQKFAPMGSATCFPVEALIFWALSVASIRYAYPEIPLKRILRSVYVYGDDIIVPRACQAVVRQLLPLFGLMFNESKCCVAGSFRESCGLDAYKGVVVTPLRVKRLWCPSLTGMSYVSYVATVNGFYDRGMFNSGDYLLSRIQSARLTPYSDTVMGCPTIIDPRKKASQENRRLKLPRRYNKRLQRFEYKSWVVRSRVVKDTATPGWCEMLRVASHKSNDSNIISHLAPRSIAGAGLVACFARHCIQKWSNDIIEPVTAYQYTLPRRSSLKRGWTCLN
jgi:hypothetical protein